MTPRERWVVYPLLFFALSLALKPKLLQEIDTKRLRCESITIEHGEQPCIQLQTEVRSGRVLGGGIQLYGEKGQPAAVITAGPDGKAGIIQTYAEGRPQMTLNRGEDDTFVDLHQTSARPANGIIYGVDVRGQKLPLALVAPNIQQALPDGIRRGLLPKVSVEPPEGK